MYAIANKDETKLLTKIIGYSENAINRTYLWDNKVENISRVYLSESKTRAELWLQDKIESFKFWIENPQWRVRITGFNKKFDEQSIINYRNKCQKILELLESLHVVEVDISLSIIK